MRDEVEAARTEMMEYAAEADDELMMKYLEGEELTTDEIYSALAKGSAPGSCSCSPARRPRTSACAAARSRRGLYA